MPRPLILRLIFGAGMSPRMVASEFSEILWACASAKRLNEIKDLISGLCLLVSVLLREPRRGIAARSKFVRNRRRNIGDPLVAMYVKFDIYKSTCVPVVFKHLPSILSPLGDDAQGKEYK